MNIKKIEIDEWFKKRIDSSKLHDFQVVRVTGVYKNSFTLRYKENDIFSEMTGNLIYNTVSPIDCPTVGDWVYAQFFNQNSWGIIHELIPRKTVLMRKMPGKKISSQLIAANVDTAFIMQSLDRNFNLRRLERYLAITKEGHISPVVLLSKSDLLPEVKITEKVKDILAIMPDVNLISFSNVNEYQLNKVKGLFLSGKTYCLLGSSGVGKTTLINQLIGKNTFKTREVRIKNGKGKHTTTYRQIIDLPNGALIIDTPGMRELGMVDSQLGIDDTFADIVNLSKYCRFNNCTHNKEEGCAVLDALHKGILPRGRYQNYMKMKKESVYYEMSYLEKRRKDKQLGRFYKKVMKEHIKKKRC